MDIKYKPYSLGFTPFFGINPQPVDFAFQVDFLEIEPPTLELKIPPNKIRWFDIQSQQQILPTQEFSLTPLQLKLLSSIEKTISFHVADWKTFSETVVKPILANQSCSEENLAVLLRAVKEIAGRAKLLLTDQKEYQIDTRLCVDGQPERCTSENFWEAMLPKMFSDIETLSGPQYPALYLELDQMVFAKQFRDATANLSRLFLKSQDALLCYDEEFETGNQDDWENRVGSLCEADAKLRQEQVKQYEAYYRYQKNNPDFSPSDLSLLKQEMASSNLKFSKAIDKEIKAYRQASQKQKPVEQYALKLTLFDFKNLVSEYYEEICGKSLFQNELWQLAVFVDRLLSPNETFDGVLECKTEKQLVLLAKVVAVFCDAQSDTQSALDKMLESVVTPEYMNSKEITYSALEFINLLIESNELINLRPYQYERDLIGVIARDLQATSPWVASININRMIPRMQDWSEALSLAEKKQVSVEYADLELQTQYVGERKNKALETLWNHYDVSLSLADCTLDIHPKDIAVNQSWIFSELGKQGSSIDQVFENMPSLMVDGPGVMINAIEPGHGEFVAVDSPFESFIFNHVTYQPGRYVWTDGHCFGIESDPEFLMLGQNIDDMPLMGLSFMEANYLAHNSADEIELQENFYALCEAQRKGDKDAYEQSLLQMARTLRTSNLYAASESVFERYLMLVPNDFIARAELANLLGQGSALSDEQVDSLKIDAALTLPLMLLSGGVGVIAEGGTSAIVRRLAITGLGETIFKEAAFAAAFGLSFSVAQSLTGMTVYESKTEFFQDALVSGTGMLSAGLVGKSVRSVVGSSGIVAALLTETAAATAMLAHGMTTQTYIYDVDADWSYLLAQSSLGVLPGMAFRYQTVKPTLGVKRIRSSSSFPDDSLLPSDRVPAADAQPEAVARPPEAIPEAQNSFRPDEAFIQEPPTQIIERSKYTVPGIYKMATFPQVLIPEALRLPVAPKTVFLEIMIDGVPKRRSVDLYKVPKDFPISNDVIGKVWNVSSNKPILILRETN